MIRSNSLPDLNGVAAQFRKHGFVKLKNLFPRDSIEEYKAHIENEALYQKVVNSPTPATNPLTRAISRKNLRIVDNSNLCEPWIEGLSRDPAFRKTLPSLAGRDMLQTNSQLFEVAPRTHTGLGWHVGYYSFTYVQLHDYACTIWIPLDPITPAQRGGMQYFSREVLGGQFLYTFARWYFKSLYYKGIGSEYLKMATSDDYLVNAASDFVEAGVCGDEIVEDEFEVGDALLFDKFVLHRSAPFLEGALQTRKAMAIRFVDANASFNREACSILFKHTEKSHRSERLMRTDPECTEQPQLDLQSPGDVDLRDLATNDPFFKTIFQANPPDKVSIREVPPLSTEMEKRFYRL